MTMSDQETVAKANKMVAELERLEMDGTQPADIRRLVRDERVGIMARLQLWDWEGARWAVDEARRVLDMWAERS